jgi:solute carrier family 25 protein 33/36
MRYRNSVDCLIQMLRTEGWRSLFRGLSASMVGISESSMQFVMYERLKTALAKPDVELTAAEYVMAASAAKMVAVAITYPHEVVRTRMREVAAEGAERKYRTFTQTFGRVWMEEGALGLYGGMAAHMVRVVPNAGIMFLTYELFCRTFAQKN